MKTKLRHDVMNMKYDPRVQCMFNCCGGSNYYDICLNVNPGSNSTAQTTTLTTTRRHTRSRRRTLYKYMCIVQCALYNYPPFSSPFPTCTVYTGVYSTCSIGTVQYIYIYIHIFSD